MTSHEFAKTNRLYYGDNLTIMRGEMPADVVDLIYLDPPFNSNKDYNAIYKDGTGYELDIQIKAFTDTWKLDGGMRSGMDGLDSHTLHKYRLKPDSAAFLHTYLETMRTYDASMYSYLTYMAVRLLEMKRVLKPTGSIYLHCDPTASHYLKMVMDCIFGYGSFGNEIIWHYQAGTKGTKHFGRKHDVILFYQMGKNAIFHRQKKPVVNPARYKFVDENGDHYDVNGQGNRYYLKDGATCDDVWTWVQEKEFQQLNSQADEREGYPTQKPLALLDRIIQASSNEGDLVFDPFCGCATTLEAANNHGRKWVGIDISVFAIKKVAMKRLEGITDYQLLGYPVDYDSAVLKANQNRFEFQEWAVGDIFGIPNSHVVNDGGDDGRIYFGSNPRRMARVEVKSGENVGISVVRDLRGVLEREKGNTISAVLVLLHDLPPKKRENFEREMAAAGTFTIDGIEYPCMQIVMVRDYFNFKPRERYRVVNLPNIVRPEERQQPALTGIYNKKSKKEVRAS